MKLKDIRIAMLLSAGFAILAGLMVLMALVGLVKAHHLNDAVDGIVGERVAPIKRLKEVSDLYAVNIVDLTNKVAAGMVTPNEGLAREKASSQAIEQAWSAYLATQQDPAHARRADRAKALMRQVAPVIETLRIALRSGEPAQVAALIQPVYASIDPLTEELGGLVDALLADAQAEQTRASAEYQETMQLFAILVSVALILSALVSWLLIRTITRPLAQAVAMADKVAQGDLTQRLGAIGNNETGRLLAAMLGMQQSLGEVVTRVRAGSEGVATASAQIAQGNHDLSTRTEQQASALQQTASSMEELSATVRQNAESANLANQLAERASSVAVSGGAVVGQVVDTMKGIQVASRRIADIIGVIDGIAFQTNILALNAAVEAARAGEQGRGFAVVATEVRSLAGRSAEAAKEIKDLIGASVERVAHGSALVDQAGTTMLEVVSAIKRVADIVGEISAASTEQAKGVVQVGDAVAQMDQTTQQNAALVEQMAAAASSLRGLATEQVDAVAVFRLPPAMH